MFMLSYPLFVCSLLYHNHTRLGAIVPHMFPSFATVVVKFAYPCKLELPTGVALYLDEEELSRNNRRSDMITRSYIFLARQRCCVHTGCS